MKAELFGREYYFPKAPFLLSLKCRVPLFFGVTVRDGFGYKTIIEGPFVYNSFTVNEMHKIINEVHRVMERYLRLYPEQWFFFQRFWEKPQDVVIL